MILVLHVFRIVTLHQENKCIDCVLGKRIASDLIGVQLRDLTVFMKELNWKNKLVCDLFSKLEWWPKIEKSHFL